MPISVNLRNWAVETASTHTKPACAGLGRFDFPLVRVGGLCFCSREFYSPGLKLTHIGIAVSLQRLINVLIYTTC